LKKGLFITFEGPEGSGKSTLLRSFGEYLAGKKIPVLMTREPGGSKLSTHLREWILNRLKYNLTPEAELFLFLADRAQHVTEILAPELEKGKIVLCDRYADSTLAYQGGGRGFSSSLLQKMNQMAARGLKADLTVLCDLPVETGLKRAIGRALGKDRMEREKISFHRRVRKTFLQIAASEPRRFLVLDGRKSREEVLADLKAGLLPKLPSAWRRRISGGA
jgi:dTMP kinase